MIRLIKSLSKTEREILLAVFLIFLVSGAFWTVRVFSKNTLPKPTFGGIYSEGIIGQPVAVNPVIAANDTDRDLIQLIFSDLLQLKEKLDVSEDQKTWTFSLKENLGWSDGEPITSDDVIFTLELIKDPDARSPLFATWQGVEAERLSERQFRLSLKTPYAFFADNLKTLRIVPRHIFENIPPANLRLSSYNLEPVGNGPFKFAGFEKRRDGFITRYSMIRNESFAGEKPFLDKFEFRFFSHKEELISAFSQKEIDGFGGIESKDLGKLRIGRRVHKIVIPSYYAVFFNPALNAQLKDKDIRLALTLATNKSGVAKEVFDSQALIIHNPITLTMEGYRPDVYKNETFSLDAASALLENKGWRRGTDGIRSKIIDRKDVRLEFEIIVPQVEFLIKTVEILKTDWEKIGVRLNPVVLRPSEITGDIIKTRNYQMLIFGTILRNNPDIFSFWHSSERFYPGGNLSLYANKTVDGLLESIKNSLDSNTRLAAIAKVQEIINQDRPAIFLFSPLYLYVTAENLGGFSAQFLNSHSDRFENIPEWHLKTTRKLK